MATSGAGLAGACRHRRPRAGAPRDQPRRAGFPGLGSRARRLHGFGGRAARPATTRPDRRASARDRRRHALGGGRVAERGAGAFRGVPADRRRLLLHRQRQHGAAAGIASAWLAAYFVASQIVLLFLGGGVGDLLPLTVWMLAAWGIGLLLNRRSQQAHEARQHATELVAESERRTEEAVLSERSRIARELHDVVAHSLSVIVGAVGGGAARAVARASEPESTDAVLDSIERTGREALVDLRRMLGLLRSVEEPASTCRRRPSLRELDELARPGAAGGPARGGGLRRSRPSLPDRGRPVRLPHRAGGADQRPQARRRHTGCAVRLGVRAGRLGSRSPTTGARRATRRCRGARARPGRHARTGGRLRRVAQRRAPARAAAGRCGPRLPLAAAGAG